MIGFIKKKAKKLFGKIKTKVKGVFGKGKESGPEHDRLVKAGLAEIPKVEKENKYLENGRISKKNACIVAKIIKKKHPVFKSIKVIDGGTTWNYRYKASPIAVIPSSKKNIFGLLSDELSVGTHYKLKKNLGKGSLLSPHHIPGQALMRDVSKLEFNGQPIFPNFKEQLVIRKKNLCQYKKRHT